MSSSISSVTIKQNMKGVNEEELQRERKVQMATMSIRKRFGKNAILKGMNLLDGATAIERNNQIEGIKHERAL